MKSHHNVIVFVGLVLGCAVAGYFAEPRFCSGAVARGAGTACSDGGSSPRAAGHRTAQGTPHDAAAQRVISAVSRTIPPALRGGGNPVADWRSFVPEAFSVQLTPELILPFRVTGVQREHGRTVLTARLDKAEAEPSGLDGAFLVSTANTADRWDAVVVLPGEEYRIHVGPEQTFVEEVHADGWRCGSDAPASAAAPARVLAMEMPPSGEAADTLLVPSAAASGSPATVDVLFLYNPDALAAQQGDLATIDADCSNFIAASNVILENSQITDFRWHYLSAVAAPAYPATTLLKDDLNQMTSGSISAFTAQEQSAYGADQVVMLVGGWRDDAAGMAWIGGNPNFAAVTYPCLTIDHTPASTATSVIVVCHEMGHSFGCRHDRITEGAKDGDGHYYYGFRFADNFGSNTVADEGTVMSYAGSRIPYFSNPNVLYHGYALGVAIGDAKAAFDAETMTENAARLAATNAAVTEPTITVQPQSAAVTVGQQLSLSVTATGTSLVYQWFKDGVTLGGATTPTYVVSSAALSDAGSYTVTVSNGLGSATSQRAAVTVSTASVSVGSTASAATASGGASSGGGAFDGNFALGLLVLLACSGLKTRGRLRLQRDRF